jgi:aconitate hydratase
MFDVRETLRLADGRAAEYVSLTRLERRGFEGLSRLPVCIRIVLESVLRNADGERIGDDDIEALARWEPSSARDAEVPFIVARVLLQDFTGVPLLVDLAAMRSAAIRQGADPMRVQPHIPVDLVVDHSVQVDHYGSPDALRLNMDMEARRNRDRYRFLKWGQQAFDGLRIVPPGFGICHQVNLESLARVVVERDGTIFPDTLVGTDSHTTMINGLGVVGWGVGGIEAEAAMLGQPVHFLTPDVIGVCLFDRLRNGVTATDLVLHVTEMLRRANVVGKFVEFHGDGAAALSVPDRATVANMAPEYGATVGYFPVDEQTCSYMALTGRAPSAVEDVRRYYAAQGLFGMPRRDQCAYTRVLELDLRDVEPSIAGPKRPQDRIPLAAIKSRVIELLGRSDAAGFGRPAGTPPRRERVRLGASDVGRPGGGEQDAETMPDGRAKDTSTLTETEMMNNRPTPNPVAPTPARPARDVEIADYSVVIAAITSCTNTSNPSVMIGAGLLAKKAVERGLSVPPWVKTSLAPGSPVVIQYLTDAGLLPYLERLGFHLVGFGCTTCIGNSGPLDRELEQAVERHALVVASVLSGNRNFEARVHQSVRANFLMSPPLVVAFALAGRVDVDLTQEPVGVGEGGPVYLRDLWPTSAEIAALAPKAQEPASYRQSYADAERRNPLWNAIPVDEGTAYQWDATSTYIREPPYFEPSLAAAPPAELRGARALAVFGDSITTDHISPAGAIGAGSPAGTYLSALGVGAADFNSYGARRGNHEVMIRGTFANVRIRNLLVAGVEGVMTVHQPSGGRLTIFEAAQRYGVEGVPLIVIAGRDYGAGSSRDWAAKGTRLLGVRAVVAASFERIHRSNLVGMGVLPCQLPEGVTPGQLRLTGGETYDLVGIGPTVRPRARVSLAINRPGGGQDTVPLVVRVDTPIEAEYVATGGILPYVLKGLS